MTGRIRNVAQSYSLSMPIVEAGFFLVLVGALLLVT